MMDGPLGKTGSHIPIARIRAVVWSWWLLLDGLVSGFSQSQVTKAYIF